MPEGPSIVILKELAQPFKGKKVIAVAGNTKEDKDRALNKKVVDFKSWGKHFLICFSDFTIRIHFLLYGSYRINERRDKPPRLSLQFRNGELNFYTNSVRILEGPLDEIYDWSEDVMSDEWDEKKAIQKLKAHPDMLACDALLDQHIFSGSGNIIKNEVLYRTKIHPLSLVGKIPPKKLKEMVQETRNYSFDFLRWKKAFELKKHYLVYNQKLAKDTGEPVLKAHLGKTNRRTFYCETQQLYLL